MSRAGHTAYQRAQSACKDFYGSTLMQSAVAVLIVANCFVRINDVEMQPDLDTEFNKNLEQLDLMFTSVFTIELCMNMFANWTFRLNCCVPAFFLDNWNNCKSPALCLYVRVCVRDVHVNTCVYIQTYMQAHKTNKYTYT